MVEIDYLLAHFVATRVGHLVDADQLSSEFLAFAAETLGGVHWSLVEERELENNLIKRRQIKNLASFSSLSTLELNFHKSTLLGGC